MYYSTLRHVKSDTVEKQHIDVSSSTLYTLEQEVWHRFFEANLATKSGCWICNKKRFNISICHFYSSSKSSVVMWAVEAAQVYPLSACHVLPLSVRNYEKETKI